MSSDNKIYEYRYDTMAASIGNENYPILDAIHMSESDYCPALNFTIKADIGSVGLTDASGIKCDVDFLLDTGSDIPILLNKKFADTLSLILLDLLSW